MTLPLLTLLLHSKRDLLVARQRARQIARLLGFDPREQACIAAAVFAIAGQAWQQSGRGTLQFIVANGTFQVLPVCTGLRGSANAMRLEKLLPNQELAVAPEDAAWVVRELTRLTPRSLFDEVWRQNQDMLLLSQEVQALQAELTQMRRGLERPSAA